MMCDPTPLVDHVYQKWIDEHFDNTDLLKALYAESKVQLPGSVLHNNNINYYDHTENSLDTSPAYTPSKMYVFLEMKANVLCKFNASEQEAKIPDCTLVIRSPNTAVTNSLLVACQRISKYQPIVDLHMFEVSWKYQSESDEFNLSENAQSLIMQSCCLPSQPLKCLIHKLSECNTIRIIDLSNTNLEAVSSLTLSNKTSLTHLDLSETKMSAGLCNSICQQLTDITHMEHLNMSNNDLSQVSKFTLSNKKTLRYLNLENTHMSLTLYYSICQQLTDLESLKQFFVSREDSCYKICDDGFLECFLSDKHLPTHVCRCVLCQINQFSSLPSIEITDSPLTGCLSSFLPDPHPGLPELKQLTLKRTALHKEDLQHLFSIIQLNKLPKLRILDLSFNTLTGCLSIFLADPHPGLPELGYLYLDRTALNKEDLQHFSHITQNNKLPKLRELDLSQNTLTGCLSSFLSDPDAGLPELRSLHLKSTDLNKDDLQHLLSITYKLPKLHKLDLSHNTLTGCLSSFLSDPHPGLPELEYLVFESTALNKKDLQHLSHIIQLNKLPKLRSLNLSHNTLMGCLSSFLTDPHPGLPELRWLHLESTALNEEDLQHLSHITKCNKLPKLQSLDLSENTLTGCLCSFLPSLPEGKYLKLRSTDLRKEDLQHIKQLAQDGKLPKLSDLNLEGNELCQMKEELVELIMTLIQRQEKIFLGTLDVWLADNDLPEEFQNKMTQICSGTEIGVQFYKEL